MAPHVPIRDLPTLIEHHGGLRGDALAAALVATAARSTGAVGVAGGLVATLEFATPPLLLTTPVQVVAETFAVVAIELKLVAELHEVYGHPAARHPGRSGPRPTWAPGPGATRWCTARAAAVSSSP